MKTLLARLRWRNKNYCVQVHSSNGFYYCNPTCLAVHRCRFDNLTSTRTRWRNRKKDKVGRESNSHSRRGWVSECGVGTNSTSTHPRLPLVRIRYPAQLALFFCYSISLVCTLRLALLCYYDIAIRFALLQVLADPVVFLFRKLLYRLFISCLVQSACREYDSNNI